MNNRLLFPVGLALLAAASGATLVLSQEHGTSPEHDTTHATVATQSEFTLLEVMQHLASAQQQIQNGLLMNNRLMIAKGASAIADHPMPKGGIAPYIKKNHVALKQTIKAMDEQVHETAVTIATRADDASMLELQKLTHTMISGCISCHNVFRD